MMERLVSIIIPTYNRKNTILDCINSCLNQTYQNIEIIVVDDASTDGTFELFSSYNDDRVKYYRYTDNKGACFARNYGIEKAKGEIITFQDSDDIWYPEKIKEQLAFLDAEDADLVFCGMNRITPYNSGSFYYPRIDFNSNEDSVEQLLSFNCISTQTIMVKRESLGQVRFDESFKRYQDWDFVLQASIAGLTIRYQKKALVESTVQPDSISSRMKSYDGYVHLYEKYKKYYSKYSKAEASIFMQMAESLRKSDYDTAKKLYFSSLKKHMNLKILIKYILYSLHLWK